MLEQQRPGIKRQVRDGRRSGNFVELKPLLGQTAQLMAVSATGRRLAMGIIRVQEQDVLASPDR